MADADRSGKIASIGQDLITTQLTDGGVVAVVETRFPKPKQAQLEFLLLDDLLT